MRRVHVALITLVGSLVVAACSERDTTSPRAIISGQSNASNTPPGPSLTCDFGATKTANRNAFSSSQDSSFTYVSAMQKAYNGGVDDKATLIGWQIGRLVAKERLTSAIKDGTALATFLVDVTRCMSDLAAGQTHGFYPPLPIAQKFIDNAVSVLTSGIWEVRGGTGVNSQVPAAGRVIDKSTGVRAFGQPRWGAEAASSPAAWPGVTQYAVFGYPTNIGALVIGAATNINTNEVPANAFELGTLPDNTPKTGIRVGICIQTDVTGGVVNRVVHNNAEILDSSFLTQLCSTTVTGYVAMGPAPSSWYASVLHQAGTFFAPNNLLADDDCAFCIGGLPSGWSPFSTGAITASNVVLTITTQPSNTRVSQTANDVAVVHATINGVPLVGVVIDSIAVSNNSGSPAGAVITDFVHGTTNTSGDATISFSVGKPGGYLITVLGHLDSFGTQSTTSKLFNVKNP
jgi:hypothetical protein